jgi:hypothetical protein
MALSRAASSGSPSPAGPRSKIRFQVATLVVGTGKACNPQIPL